MEWRMKTLLCVVLLAACGGSKKPEPAPPPPPTSGPTETPPAGSAAGSATAEASAAGSASAEGSAAQAQDVDWAADAPKIDGKIYKDLDKKGRAQLMKQYVLPKAKELFASFDPKFGDVTCKTCHGDGAENHTFKMPNPKIKQLPGTEEAFMTWVKQNPEEGKWAGFMAQQLEPAMGHILGVKPFDPRTKTGDFSCFGCHTMKK
jgi:hypothetical protein